MRRRGIWRSGVAVFANECVPHDLDYAVVLPARHLLDAGFEVHLVGRRDIGELPPDDGVFCHVCPSRLGVAAKIASLRAEILFYESTTEAAWSGRLAKRTWVRNPGISQRRPVASIQRRTVGWCDAISFTNPALRAEWAVPLACVVDLLYPLDTRFWSAPDDEPPDLLALPGIGRTSQLIVTVANFTRNKRQIETVEWLAPLLRDRPDTTLVLAGYAAEPGLDDAIDAAAEVAGVTQQVVRTGWLPASTLRALYCRASVAVVASLAETQCLALYEGLAAGVPAVVSAIPQLMSQFPELPSFRNGGELLRHVERLLDDPDERASLVAVSTPRVALAEITQQEDLFYSTLERLLGRPMR